MRIHAQRPNVPVDTSAIKQARFGDLRNKYNGTDFIYEFRAPEKNIWDRFVEWIASWFRNLFQIASTERSVMIVNYLFKVLAVIIVLVMIYLIAKTLLNKEGKWIFGKNTSRKIVDYDAVEKNLQATDFQKLIDQTLASGNLRLAVRYYYLWLLQRLSDTGKIRWDVEKTNSDYLYEIGNEKLRDEFSYLSYLYNYIWYGEFTIDEPTFAKAKKAFENAIKSVR